MEAGLESFEQLLLTGLLEGQPSNYSIKIHTRFKNKVSPQVQNAEAFMLNDAQEDIGIDDIVAASGLLYRTLYDGFKRVLKIRASILLTFIRDHIQEHSQGFNISTSVLFSEI